MKAIGWDWKEQPPWDLINEAIYDLRGEKAELIPVDTESDSYAVVIAPQGTKPEDAQRYYDQVR